VILCAFTRNFLWKKGRSGICTGIFEKEENFFRKKIDKKEKK